jgi:hypothetical protein
MQRHTVKEPVKETNIHFTKFSPLKSRSNDSVKSKIALNLDGLDSDFDEEASERTPLGFSPKISKTFMTTDVQINILEEKDCSIEEKKEEDAFDEDYEVYPFCLPVECRDGTASSTLRDKVLDGIFEEGFSRKYKALLQEGEDAKLKKNCTHVNDISLEDLKQMSDCRGRDIDLTNWQISVNDERVWNNETNLSVLNSSKDNVVFGELTCQTRWLRLDSTNELPMKFGFNFLDLFIFCSVLGVQSLGFVAYICSFSNSACNDRKEWKTVLATFFCVCYLSGLLTSDMHKNTVILLNNFTPVKMISKILSRDLRKFRCRNSRTMITVSADALTQFLGITASVYTIGNSSSAVDLLLNFTVIGTLMSLDNIICSYFYFPDVRRTLRYKDAVIHRAVRFRLEHSLNQTKAFYFVILTLAQFIFLGGYCGYLG